jgi:hypothetical protein
VFDKGPRGLSVASAHDHGGIARDRADGLVPFTLALSRGGEREQSWNCVIPVCPVISETSGGQTQDSSLWRVTAGLALVDSQLRGNDGVDGVRAGRFFASGSE